MILKESKSFAVSVNEVYASVVRIVKRLNKLLDKIVEIYCTVSSLPQKISNKKKTAWPECSRKCWCPQPGANVLSRELIMFDQRNAFSEEIETLQN